MVSISMALEAAVAVIVLIFIVFLFFQVFSNTECNSMSDTTAADLADAISKVSLEDGVQPWTKDEPPTIDDTDYYLPVSIRLCEVNSMNGLAAQFVAQQPTYMLVFESWGEESLSWSETRTWSGGGASAILQYVLMSRATKLVTLAPKYSVAFARWAGGGVIKTLTKYSWDLITVKLKRGIDYFRDSRVTKWFLARLGKSNTQTTAGDTVSDLLNPRYITESNIGLANIYNDARRNEEFGMVEILVAMGIIEGKVDTATGKFIPEIVGNKYVVNKGYNDFMINFVDGLKICGAKDGICLRCENCEEKLMTRRF